MKTVKVALFGVNASSNQRLAMELQLALHALALPLRFDVLQPSLTVDNRFVELDFHLCFLQAIDSKLEPADQTNAEEAIRQTLNDRSLSYQVLYGLPRERLATTLQAVRERVERLWPTVASLTTSNLPNRLAAARDTTASWGHACEHCGDPESERTLLSSLIAGHSKTVPADG